VIFLAEAAPRVLAHWVPCGPSWREHASPPAAEYHVYPKDLACLEWTRTTWLEDGRVIAGWYYLSTGERSVLPEEQQDRLRRLMTSLASWIRRTYPCKSSRRHPAFIGPALAAELAAGTRRLVYANGRTPVELVQ
jgi:hypothetical protein